MKLAHIAAFSGCGLTPFNPNHGALPETPLPLSPAHLWNQNHPSSSVPFLCEPATNEHTAPWSQEASGKEGNSTRSVFPRITSGQHDIPKTLTAVI